MGKVPGRTADLVGSVSAVLGQGTADLDAIEGAAATYLANEQRLGRVAAAAAPGTLALALVDGFTTAAPR